MANASWNVNELSKELLLHLVEKCYRSVYINKCFYETIFHQNAVLPLSNENQQKILAATVDSFHVKQYPPPLSYRKFFLKIFLKEVENSRHEVSEELFIAYVHTLTETSSQDALWFHCYFINETEVIAIQENSNFVVNSTTGLRTWEAAKYLTEWCIEHSHLFKNRHILELGSGTGLVGIALCKLVEPSVFTFTDKSPDVLRLISSNLQMNLPSLKASTPLQDDNEATFDKNISPSSSLHPNASYCHSSCKIDICRLKWENVSGQRDVNFSPNIILAADVVYDPTTVPHLVRVIHTFLVNGAQCAYVAYVVRNSDTHSCFLNHLDLWSLKREDLAGPEKLELFYDDLSCLKICKISLT